MDLKDSQLKRDLKMAADLDSSLSLEDVARRLSRRRTKRRMVGLVFGLAATLLMAGVLVLQLGPLTNHSPSASHNRHRVSAVSGNPNVDGEILLQHSGGGADILTPATGTTSAVSTSATEVTPYDFSPDGAKVLAGVDEVETSGITRGVQLITITRSSGTTTTIVQASSTQSLGPAAWSPDGTRVAYIKTVWSSDPNTTFPGDPQSQTLCVRELTPVGQTTCYTAAGTAYGFAWSPDSSKIVVAGPGTQDIYVLTISTGSASTLIPAGGNTSINSALTAASLGTIATLAYPTWSSSGSYLAFDAVLNSSGDVPLIVSSSGSYVALGTSNLDSQALAWSPTSDVLAYTVGVNGPTQSPEPSVDWGVYTLTASTQVNQLILDTGSRGVLGLQWSPSGSYIALDETSQISIIDTTGTVAETASVTSGDLAQPLVKWGV